MVTELGAESSRLSPVLLAKCQYCLEPFAGSHILESGWNVYWALELPNGASWD
jgi:hypothetical protein